MIRNLAEVKKSSSLTDKTHGTVTLGPKETLGSKDKIAYVYLKAEGNAVKHLTDPHITNLGQERSERLVDLLGGVQLGRGKARLLQPEERNLLGAPHPFKRHGNRPDSRDAPRAVLEPLSDSVPHP